MRHGGQRSRRFMRRLMERMAQKRLIAMGREAGGMSEANAKSYENLTKLDGRLLLEQLDKEAEH